jgi:FkbM family methyltransferase
MTQPVEPAPFGSRAPDRFVRVVLALTRSLPANRLGLRISTPFRRIAINWLGEVPVDTVIWGARMRLHPSRNGCEKNALFTPQIIDALERDVLAAAIDRRVAEGKTFVFVDVGANVGLYSLFVAARGSPHTHVLAIEPQPIVVDRLRFNAGANPGFDISIVQLAVTDRDGEMSLVISERDLGGSHLDKVAGAPASTRTVRVRCRPLSAILADAGVSSIDALKIDIEGAEDMALEPFLRDAPPEQLPRLMLVEDRTEWTLDVYSLLRRRGYVELVRGRQNVIFRLT